MSQSALGSLEKKESAIIKDEATPFVKHPPTMKFRDDIEIDSLENSRPTSPDSFENEDLLDGTVSYDDSEHVERLAELKKLNQTLGKTKIIIIYTSKFRGLASLKKLLVYELTYTANFIHYYP